MLILTFTYVGLFIAVQVLIMVLTIFDFVKPESFLVELNTLILVLMIFLNAFALTNYCRNAGNPYLNEGYKKYVRKYKVIVVVWNLAFILKFFMTTFGVTILDLDD